VLRESPVTVFVEVNFAAVELDEALDFLAIWRPTLVPTSSDGLNYRIAIGGGETVEEFGPALIEG
jgi:hypothetical protein